METVDSKHIHKNEVNKAYFQLTAAHGDFCYSRRNRN